MRGSANFGRPACSALQGGRPQFAGLSEMLALLQQLLPDVARHQGVAVLIHPRPKELTRHTNTGTSAVAQLPLVHIAHSSTTHHSQHTCTSSARGMSSSSKAETA